MCSRAINRTAAVVSWAAGDLTQLLVTCHVSVGVCLHILVYCVDVFARATFSFILMRPTVASGRSFQTCSLLQIQIHLAAAINFVAAVHS